MDGYITIGTELNTDKFDRQVNDLKKKIEKEEKKKIEIDASIANLEEEVKKYDEARSKVQEYKNELKKLNQERSRMVRADPSLAVAQVPETSAFGQLEQQISSINQLLHEEQNNLNKQGTSIDRTYSKLEQQRAKHEEINGKIDEYNQKIQAVSFAKQKAEVDKIKNSFDGVGSSIQKAVRRAGMLAISIIGIRSGLAMIRSASSQLASYDKQYATDLEYIRYALTQAIAPALRYVVNLAMQLLGYINAIVQGWFGINLFSKASASSFNEMKSSAGGIAKSAKEIHKQLAGFDELNVLQDDSSSGGGGGGGGITSPSMDLSGMQGEKPEWLNWIIGNKDLILSALGGIVTALTLMKLGLSGIKALGIGLIIGGILYAVQGLLAYLQNPSWENFGKIIQGIGVALIGLGITIASLPVAVAGAIVLIFGTIIRYWEQNKSYLQGGINWLKGKSGWVHEFFGGWIGGIYDLFVGLLEDVLTFFDGIYTAIKQIFDGIIEFFKGVFTGNWQQAWNGLKTIVTGVLNYLKSYFILGWNWLQKVIITPMKNWFGDLWNNFKNGAIQAWEGIKSVFSKVANFFKTIFTNAWEGVKRVFSTGGKIFDGIKEGIANAFKTIVNKIIGGINKVVSTPFNAINNMLSTLRSVSIAGYQPFSFIHTFNVPQIPYLKTGAIVNMPNKGTLVGGGTAFAGEAGREGVIPLTDQQAMAELGREIGRNVLINLTNIMSMNGRVISRELKNLKNEQDFAYNI